MPRGTRARSYQSARNAPCDGTAGRRPSQSTQGNRSASQNADANVGYYPDTCPNHCPNTCEPPTPHQPSRIHRVGGRIEHIAVQVGVAGGKRQRVLAKEATYVHMALP